MAGRECYHCKQWVEKGEEDDGWTTTAAAKFGSMVAAARELRG